MDIAGKTQEENEERVAEEYYSSLSDLTCNSKPLINMLTMLAEENIEYAAVIVKVVADHISKVPPDIKLPILYLIDSIVKNVKNTYVQLFSQCIVSIFCDVFEKVTEKVRERMYALRQTWNEVFSPHKLYTLDVKVKRMDNNWPITAKQPQPSIHVNPNFLKTVNASQAIPTDMEEILHVKTRELLELKKRKLELELEATKKHLEEQEKQLSKATESVIPPIDALVAANAPLQPAIRAPGTQPTHMMPGFIAPHHQRHGPVVVGAAVPTSTIRPGMYHHNFRNPRAQQMPNLIASRMLTMPPQSYPAAGNVGKPKVHPVDLAMLNTVRHRDPRLARQLQQQNLQFVQMGRGNGDANVAHNAPKSAESTKNDAKKSSSSSSYRSNSTNSKLSRNANGSVAESKSPTRNSSSRSMGRSAKTGTSRSDKERDRKRSESKSSTTSSSSAASISPSGSRRKDSVTAAVRSNQGSVDTCDKDAFEIVPLSEFKHKSSSPSVSPTKITKESNKRSKDFSKPRNNQRNKNQRSPSPQLNASKDVDLRTLSTSSSTSESASPEKRLKLSDGLDHVKEDSNTVTTSTSNDLDKNIKIMLEPSKDVDLRQLTSSSIELKPRQVAAPATRSDSASVVATSSPKVSFKIQKLFNKLEKSTRNLSTVSNANAAAVSASSSTAKQSIVSIGDGAECGSAAGASGRHALPAADTIAIDSDYDNENDDAKKRPSTVSAEEDNVQPLPKKSKQSSKLDALFGSEDVDLRTVIPPQMLAVQKPATSEVLTPPPPPIISDEETPAEISRENAFCRKAFKTKIMTATKGSQKKLSLLDDVRAKLAKAAKYNKIKKSEKSSNELNQRFKLADLNVSEDTQEANDEKIRTIITQAQELLEANSISPEQYKNLVQTVMSINETNKLEEAKRREALNVGITKAKQPLSGIDEDELEADSSNAEAERREAVLKKRIPKLPRGSSSGVEKFGESLGEKRAPGQLSYEDKKDSNDDGNAVKFGSSSGKDKRAKASKWSDRVESGNAPTMPVAEAGSMGAVQKPWLMSYGNKHHRGVFRPTVPHPPLPPLPNPNLRMPQPPWQMGSTAAPPPFMNSMAIMPRGNAPVLQQPPANAGPLAPPKPCNSIDNPQADLVRTITIDGLAKEIRIYDQVAIVFMELDQPREIGFQAGQRSIIIDNQEPITLQFNDDYRSFSIAGETHRLRFGFPSRELYIDENWYEIYFGGPPVSIPNGNKIHILKAEGPPPQVNIGPLRRDLVVGKISMIVDAHTVIPLFLDARVQSFRLGEQEHSIQFADNLLTVLLDGEPIKVEYGGLPKSLTLGGHKYFIRFGALPQGVVAGKVGIVNMAYVKTQPEPVEDAKFNTNDAIVTNASIPAVAVDVGTELKMEADLSQAAQTTSTLTAASNLTLPMAVLSNINIDELFQKLVSKGILPGATKKVASEEVAHVGPEDETPAIAINPIDLAKSDTIKTRQSAIVATLFSGMQCSSCGVRFPPEQTIKYSQHLDWHFRQNRRERDSSRKAHSRRWYYDLSDWVQYEEVEDLEEREKNFFESQQNELDANDEASNQRSTHSPAPSCPAGPDDVDRICDMCNERFEQFYNEDLEEWHLRLAIRIEDKIYHPICYDDYKASLKPLVVAKDEPENVANAGPLDDSDDNAMDTVIKVEGDKSSEEITVPDDGDDDDVIMLPNEEPSVTEIDDDDDEEYEPFNVTREEMGIINEDVAKGEENSLNDAAESDVEIQEPNIPFTDLDTYVEKQQPEDDDASRLSFANVKIKEEPKDDEHDEDDDFEDVGTVVVTAEEEISVHSSSAEAHIQSIESSTSTVSPATAEVEGAATDSPISIDATEPTEATSTELNISSMDGDLETEGKHNLSAVGPAPAIPLASLVNKIKINITKNVASTTTATTNTTSSEHTSGAVQPPTVSTIPVLCGGTASAPSNFTTTSTDSKVIDSAAMLGTAVSTISVIGGSYGRTLSPSDYQQQQQQQVPPAKPTRQPTPPPAPVEETITYEQKAPLQKASLKKVKKVDCGIETSGLCSIM